MQKTQYRPKRDQNYSAQWDGDTEIFISPLQQESQAALANRRKIISSADRSASTRSHYFDQERLKVQQESGKQLMDKIIKKMQPKKQNSYSGTDNKRDRSKRGNETSRQVEQVQDLRQMKNTSSQSQENKNRERSFEFLPINKFLPKPPTMSRRQVIQEELNKFANQQQPIVNKFIMNSKLGMHQIGSVTSRTQNIPLKNPNLIQGNNQPDVNQTIEQQKPHQVHMLMPSDLPDIQAYNKRQYQQEIDSKVLSEDQKKLLRISKSQSKIVTDLSSMYERGKLRKHYVKLTQVHSLPEERRVLMQQQGLIKGQKSEYLVEVSMTKLKFYFTAVKISNHYVFQVIELHRKLGEKLLSHVLPQDFISQLEFIDGKKLVIRDLENILMYGGFGKYQIDLSSNEEMNQSKSQNQTQNSFNKSTSNQNIRQNFEQPSQQSISFNQRAPEIKAKVGMPRVKSLIIKIMKNQESTQQINLGQASATNRNRSSHELKTKSGETPNSSRPISRKVEVTQAEQVNSMNQLQDEKGTIKINQYLALNSLKRKVKRNTKQGIDLRRLTKIKENGYKGPLFTIKERPSDDYGTFKALEKILIPQKQNYFQAQQIDQKKDFLSEYQNIPMQAPLKEQQVDDEPSIPNNIR